MLDSRFKLRHITHLLRKKAYKKDEVQIEIKELRDILMSFCNAYAPKEAPRKEKKVAKVVSNSSTRSTLTTSGNDTRGRASILKDWRKTMEESDEAVIAHEVDKYLKDPLEFTTKGEYDFPILMCGRLIDPNTLF